MRKSLLTLLAILIVPIALTIIWYRPGLLLGTGETSLPFYSLEKNYQLAKYSWQEHVLGNPSGFVTLSGPFYLVLHLFETFLPATVLQMLVFFIILSAGSLSMFFLFHKNRSLNDRIYSSFFYNLNLVTIVLIWNRFQYTFMFFFAMLPVGFLIYARGLEEKKLKYILWFNLIQLPFILAFASLPLIILFWGIITAYTLYKIIIQQQYSFKSLKFYALYFLGSLLLWIACNVWWMTQYLTLITGNDYVVNQVFGNASGFIDISNQLGNLAYVFRLMHSDFFKGMNPIWGNIYQSPLFTVLSFTIPVLAFFPLIQRKKKPTHIYIFLALALTILFFTKGAAPPFGELFLILFTHLRFLEAFRNPFEKIALALPFVYAPLVGYSLYQLHSWIKTKNSSKNAYLLEGVIGIFLFVVLAFPLWNRWVFTSNFPPANNLAIGDYVKVPEYYSQANEYINQDKNEFRNIALPIKGEGINYAWEYGYAGVDLSNSLLDKPTISLSTSVQFLEPIASQLHSILTKHPENYYQVMQLLNTRYTIVRSDIDYKLRDMVDPKIVNQQMMEAPNVPLDKTFGKLTLYKLQDNNFLPKIYAANTITTIEPFEQNIFDYVLPYSEYVQGEVFVASNDLPPNLPETYIKQDIVTPKILDTKEDIKKLNATYLPIQKPDIQTENALIELPHVSILPDSQLYFLVRLKENWFKKKESWSDANLTNLRTAGKRLVEMYKLNEKKVPQDKIATTYADYNKELKTMDPGYMYLFEGVQKELARHEYILHEIIKMSPEAENNTDFKDALETIETLFTKGIQVTSGLNVHYTARSYDLQITKPNKYSLIAEEWENNIKKPEISLQLNGEVITNKPGDLNKTLNVGNYKINFPEDNFNPKVPRQPQVKRDRTILARAQNTQYQTHRLPTLTFQKINPTLYQVHVSDATDPFILTFSESFHPLWEANIDKNKIDAANHFLSNGYANSWYVTKTGNYDMTIKFKAEDTFRIGKYISAIAIVAAAVVGMYCSKSKKKVAQ